MWRHGGSCSKNRLVLITNKAVRRSTFHLDHQPKAAAFLAEDSSSTRLDEMGFLSSLYACIFDIRGNIHTSTSNN